MAIDRRMVQTGWFSAQTLQIVQGIEDLMAMLIAPLMPGHNPPFGHDLHPVHVALDGHGREGIRPRHAVAVAVKGHGLVLVHLARLIDAGIETMPRQRLKAKYPNARWTAAGALGEIGPEAKSSCS